MEVVIDPFVLALPVPESKERVEEYLAWLVEWSGFLRKERKHCFASEAAIAQLHSEGAYPTMVGIQRIIDARGIEGISARDVGNVVRVIAETRPFIEDRCGVRELVCAGEMVLNPKSFATRLSDATAGAFCRSLIASAIGRKDGWDTLEVFIGTRPNDELREVISMAEGAVEVCVEGNVELFETVDGETCEGPGVVVREFGMIFRAPGIDIREDVDLRRIYRDVARATRHMYELHVSPFVADTVLEPVIAGPEFIDSMESLGLHNDGSVLRRVFLLAAWAGCGHIRNVPGAGVHAVRASRAADSPQVERSDGAKLWRCTITSRGAGFRLHYWLLRCGSCELQKVVVESEV